MYRVLETVALKHMDTVSITFTDESGFRIRPRRCLSHVQWAAFGAPCPPGAREGRRCVSPASRTRSDGSESRPGRLVCSSDTRRIVLYWALWNGICASTHQRLRGVARCLALSLLTLVSESLAGGCKRRRESVAFSPGLHARYSSVESAMAYKA